MHTGYERAWRRWDVVAVAGLIGWLLFDLTARTLFGAAPWPRSAVDYCILYNSSRYVVETHQYTPNYPYPPSAVAIHAASAAFPFVVSASLWLALTGLAAVGSYAVLARILGLHQRPGLLCLLPLAHVVVAYYFQWDMRSINCNLVVLATILFGCAALMRQREAAAGFWFALAVALKVLPVLVLPYLVWTRRWRAFVVAVMCSLVFWGALPVVAFGTTGFQEVYSGWFGELTRATDPALKNMHPILISLDKAAAHVARGDVSLAKGIVLLVRAVWVTVGLAGAVACWGRSERDGRRILTHVSLLVLGPVAVNPYLEAYHLVPLAVPALILLVTAADRFRSARERIVAAIGFVVGLAILKVSGPWPVRGLLVNLQALTLCATAVWVTWDRRRDVSSPRLLWKVRCVVDSHRERIAARLLRPGARVSSRRP
ncbi:hypothetical protein : Uncharacterized protein OS=Bradyrhizobium sp. WSM1253 GN=Bra1253DRAFT_02096 PE=4 SV=1: DUF2029 [Gemmata massiliana]|uniref:DUF2029 domain-containing protein n=1 Tax=Gemmata massiliana TaxID=1210884 RepID=A0A6P2CRE3_9BACT|nr:glycosyltransferase family 87 protein [Gemmata massiliana]VTR91469.1 hypothetical protein : Uncharacterized protein OS=Bradyrhizobium sp. WSM1253 GN=Bra1253DRAFT_02096 PE=4 SV=1: DUF2029 [Gemmata massiliana]